MVAVYPFRYSKGDLDAAPEAERTFYLMLCHLVNDTTFLQKVMLTALNGRDRDEATVAATTAVALTMLRLLAGRVREGFQLIQESWSPIAKAYPEIEKGHAYIKDIRRYFNTRDNAIHRLRNDAGFHESPDHVRKAFDSVEANAEMVDYLTIHQGNTVYYGADLIRAIAMQHVVEYPDLKTMLEKIPIEVATVAALFRDFANEFVPAFWQRYIPHLLKQKREDIETDVPGPPLDEVLMTFFTEQPTGKARG